MTRRVPVILNGSAGRGSNADTVAGLQARFAAHGLEAHVHVAATGDDLSRIARELVREAPPLIVAAGGDGTVSCIASNLQGTKTALGVLPMGTLNHFARDVGIPGDLDAAIEVIASGRAIDVDVGVVNEVHFINNASLGLYPDIVRDRTRQQRRLGRGKYWAMTWATLTALRRSSFLHLTLELDGEAHTGRAPFVFIGNNGYVMEGFGIGRRSSLRDGRLSVYTTRRRSRFGLVALAFRALAGRLEQADDFLAQSVKRLRVESRHRHLHVATDGEVTRMRTPLEIRSLPGALRVIAPGSAP
ncbi:MAG TPA: diacylglycerol kinase family protein [Usitatibacter sp.]|jgi:YegS/Rv2252/BmrU family lipid kinase|nr:diacylglycerol kinase family protein [Usitatibacter sp.]